MQLILGKRILKPAAPEVTLELPDVCTLVVCYTVTDVAGHREHCIRLIHTEPVVAAACKDEAVAWAAAKGIHCVANADFPRLTDACLILCDRYTYCMSRRHFFGGKQLRAL